MESSTSSNEQTQEFLGRRGVTLRALLWGVTWGVGVGSVEAAWHLITWTLHVPMAGSAGFAVRALLSQASFFGLWTAAVTAALLLLPAIRRRVREGGMAAGTPLIVGALVAGGLALFGLVTWRVGFQINASRLSPVLLGGAQW